MPSLVGWEMCKGDRDGAVPAVAYTKKLVIDYFLEGDSVRSNPHLRAFTASSSPAE